MRAPTTGARCPFSEPLCFSAATSQICRKQASQLAQAWWGGTQQRIHGANHRGAVRLLRDRSPGTRDHDQELLLRGEGEVVHWALTAEEGLASRLRVSRRDALGGERSPARTMCSSGFVGCGSGAFCSMFQNTTAPSAPAVTNAFSRRGCTRARLRQDSDDTCCPRSSPSLSRVGIRQSTA